MRFLKLRQLVSTWLNVSPVVEDLPRCALPHQRRRGLRRIGQPPRNRLSGPRRPGCHWVSRAASSAAPLGRSQLALNLQALGGSGGRCPLLAPPPVKQHCCSGESPKKPLADDPSVGSADRTSLLLIGRGHRDAHQKWFIPGPQ